MGKREERREKREERREKREERREKREEYSERLVVKSNKIKKELLKNGKEEEWKKIENEYEGCEQVLNKEIIPIKVDEGKVNVVSNEEFEEIKKEAEGKLELVKK